MTGWQFHLTIKCPTVSWIPGFAGMTGEKLLLKANSPFRDGFATAIPTRSWRQQRLRPAPPWCRSMASCGIIRARWRPSKASSCHGTLALPLWRLLLPLSSSVDKKLTIMTTSPTAVPATLERTRRNQSNAYFVAFITLGLAMSSLGPTLPGLAENTRSSLSQISVLFTAQSLGMLTGNLVSGRYYDRRPAHPFLAIIVVIISAMLTLIPFMTSLVTLAAVIFVIGVCAGSIDVGGNTLLMWIFGRQVGPHMNALHFFFGVGAFMSPIFVAQAMPSRWHHGGLLGIGRAGHGGGSALSVGACPAIPHAPSSHTPPSHTSSACCSATCFSCTWAQSSALAAGSTPMRSRWTWRPSTAAYLTSLFWAALTFGRLISIQIAGRVRPALPAHGRSHRAGPVAGVAAGLLPVRRDPVDCHLWLRPVDGQRLPDFDGPGRTTSTHFG